MKKITFGLLIVLISLITACSSTATPSSSTTLSGAEFTLVATDIVYDKKTLEVTAGQPLKIIFRNDGFLEHDFSIMKIAHSGTVMTHEDHGMGGHDMGHMHEQPDVHVAAAMNGGSSTLEFTPSEPGEYEYYCTVAGHKEAGMVGKLIVTAP
ncbi:MAG: multicopper oxidase domain-containing protein [Anaerolineae bacterium]|nr:multicopper oxidase domain-containing protein [Anaerolineae bacterium]